MSDVARTLVRHRTRINDIVAILSRYGFAEWAARGTGIQGVSVAERLADHFTESELRELGTGERLRLMLTELGTTWVKLGQMLSLRPDLVGADVADELGRLQASVPPDAPGLAQATVEGDLGQPVAELFSSFDSEPIGSGSVAQVHRATLHDGSEVAVKIVHAGADRKVLDDLDLMQALARYLEEQDPELAQYRPTVLVGEFQEMMLGAINLGQELTNLQRFTANFADEPDVIIPTPYPELSSSRVLTMSMVKGAPFSSRESIEAVGWDVNALVERAANIYLEMIFRDGIYHADPHPGNFLLPDSQHVAILDFGDVGRLSSARRDQLETLVIAVGTRDVDALTTGILAMTTPPPDVDMAQLRSDIESWLQRYFLAGVAHLDMAGIITSGTELMRKNRLVLPADLALLFRVLLRLQGLGASLDIELHVTELIKPYATEMMAARFSPKRLAHQALTTARNWDHLVRVLPDEVLSTFDRIRSGQVGVDFRVRDEDHVVDSLVDGLIASASVLASAQLIARRAGPTIAGISVPGLVAVGVGVTTWQRLVSKRRPHKSMLTRARELRQVVAG